MNSSLFTASAATHVKIVVIGLIAAIVMTAIGINAHVGDSQNAIASIKSDGTIVKARGKATVADDGVSSIR